MKLKELRKEIQQREKTDVNQVSEEMELSVRSIYRAEDKDRFEESIFTKYLIFLRKRGIDLNEVFDELI